MKKSLLLLLATAMLVVCLAAPMAMAEEASGGRGSKQSIAYGTGTVELELVDDFGAEPEYDSDVYGYFEWENGALHLGNDTGGFFDIYRIESSMLSADPVLAGAKYIVFSMENQSDDAVSICYQPTNDEYVNMYMRPNDDNPVLLVDRNGIMNEAEFDAAPGNGELDWMANGRYAFNVPEGFRGYVFIPVTSLCVINQWDTSLYTESPEITRNGFHVLNKDCWEVLVLVDDMFITGDLPEYTAPDPGSIPTEAPTEAPTDEPTSETTEPAEESPDDEKNDDNKPTATNSSNTGDEEASGSAFSIAGIIGVGIAAAVIVLVVVVILVVKKTKK